MDNTVTWEELTRPAGEGFAGRVREVTLSVGRTVNMGNYESLRLDLSAVAVIAEGGSITQAVETLSAELVAALDRLEEDERRRRQPF